MRQLQHANNVVSIDKHNSGLNKKVGDRVKSGEVIGYAPQSSDDGGSSFLVFELWHNGIPTDPEGYITF